MKITYMDLLLIIQSTVEDAEIEDLQGLYDYLEENANLQIEFVEDTDY